MVSLALHLALIIKHCVPESSVLFRTAEEVIDVWRLWDKDLFSQVVHAMTQNIWINSKVCTNLSLYPNLLYSKGHLE